MDGEENTKKQRISKLSAILMIVVAIILDIISLIPILGAVLSFLIFGFWFYIKGIPLISTKKIGTYITSLIIETWPAISFLPSITIGVIYIILITTTEDKTGISLPTKKLLSKKPILPSSK